MASFFEQVASFFGMNNAAQAEQALPEADPFISPPQDAMMFAPQAPLDAVNENVPLLDDLADEAMTKLLAKHPLQYALGNLPARSWLSRNPNVKAVEITAPSCSGNGHLIQIEGDDTDGVDLHEARIVVRLEKAYGNFTPSSINHAIHGALREIPVLKGKIKEEPERSPTYGEVWKGLEPILRKHTAKFPEADVQLLHSFFKTNEKNVVNQFSAGVHVRAGHADGKVQFTIHPAYTDAPKSTSNTSSDQQIIEYITKHETDIKQQMIAKAAALGVEGVTAETLKELSIKAAMKGESGWDQLTVEFGTKGEPLTATPLAKIDTDKLQSIFMDVLIDESKSLPAILPHISNGEIIGKILKARVGNDPQIAQLLQQDCFLSSEQRRANYEAEDKAGLVKLKNVQENGDNKHEVSLTFHLPKGVTLQQFRESVASTLQHQQSALTVGQAVAIGM